MLISLPPHTALHFLSFRFLIFRITDIKYNSPAHISGKIEDGDEIIQINYQTVVGWHYKRVLQQLQESPPDVLLTLKKRPRHTKIYGQIYMKPYRLPSKKRSLPYRFGENLPSPRIEFIPSVQNFPVLLPLTEQGVISGAGGNLSDSDSSSSSSILLPAESTAVKSNEKDLRLYLPKPRAVLQRRNTICGDQASGYRGNITFWHEMTIRRTNIDGNSLRDKSVSVGFGLDSTKRPITCIGIHSNKEKYGDLSGAMKGSLPDMKTTKDHQEQEKMSTPPSPSPSSSTTTPASNAKPLPNDVNDNMISTKWGTTVGIIDDAPRPEHIVGRSRVVKFNPSHDIIEHAHDTHAGSSGDSSTEIGATTVLPSLPMKQKQQQMGLMPANNSSNGAGGGTGLAEAINVTLIKSKSEQQTKGMSQNNFRDEGLFRTLLNFKLFFAFLSFHFAQFNLLLFVYFCPPTNSIDKPPEIGPRNEFLKKIAPKPPPRPSKAAELVQGKFDMLRQARASNSPINAAAATATAATDTHHTAHNATFDTFNDAKKHTLKSPTVANEPKIPEMTTSSPLLQNVLKHTVSNDDSAKSLPTPSPSSQKIYSSKYNNSSMDSSSNNASGGGGANTEESELLTPNRTKTLTLKKKNSILAKRRKISLKTLELSDIQGHLFRRTKDKHGVTYWAKLYFVLVESALYGFRNKNSQKANCLIFLPGFTISLAKEVHSKPFAYKVYHPKKTFYFAAESEQALSQWMDYIRRATLKGNIATIDPMQIDRIDTRDIFSETDSSEDENDSLADATPPSSTTNSFKHSFLGKSSKKRGSVDDTSSSHSSSAQPKSEKYHLGFGSLKKFTNLHNLPFSSSKSEKEREERKKQQNSDIPVPTAQFRSYRKIPGNAGMQLGGSNSMAAASSAATPMDYSNMMAQQQQQQRNQQPQSLPTQQSSSSSSPLASVINDSMQSLNECGTGSGAGAKAQHSPTIISGNSMTATYDMGGLAPPLTPSALSIISATTTSPSTPIVTVAPATIITSTPTTSKSTAKSNGDSVQQQTSQAASAKTFEPHFLNNKPISKLSKNKTSPFNYMHASNPNLVEFTFQTSKTLDVGLPKVNVSNTFDQHQNLQGFITLKDLMLQHEEDEANNMYNNRVNLGVEKPGDRHAKHHHRSKQHRGRPSIGGNDGSFIENGDDCSEIAESLSSAASIAAGGVATTAGGSVGVGSGTTVAPVNKIQRRSLPKTPDYAQSFKTDDSDIIMARSKEGQKLRDFGYEFISGDDINNGGGNNMNNNHNHYNNNHHHHHHHHQHGGVGGGAYSNSNSNNSGALITNPSGATKPAVLAKPTDRFLLPKRKGLNWIGLNLDHHKRNDSDDKPIGKGSFKATKPKHSTPAPTPTEWQTTIDANRVRNDTYNDSATSSMSSSAGFHASTPTAYTGSNRNDSVHFPFTNGDRKASAPNATSYLSKLTFGNNTKTAKEKRLLGSPRLHRAASSIFGRKNVESPTIDAHNQNFTQHDSFALPKYNANNDYASSMNAGSGSGGSIGGGNDTITSRNDSLNEIGGGGGSSGGAIPTPNFIPLISPSLGPTSDQNIEYPPIFVPMKYQFNEGMNE